LQPAYPSCAVPWRFLNNVDLFASALLAWRIFLEQASPDAFLSLLSCSNFHTFGSTLLFESLIFSIDFAKKHIIRVKKSWP
jgi:hypothetical protein